jgi:hypothetical protein
MDIVDPEDIVETTNKTDNSGSNLDLLNSQTQQYPPMKKYSKKLLPTRLV